MKVLKTLTAGGAPRSAHVAQSVEHFLGKEEVTGSNPVMGSMVQPAWMTLSVSAAEAKPGGE